MPSLCSTSGSDPTESARTKQCHDNRMIPNKDEVTTAEESNCLNNLHQSSHLSTGECAVSPPKEEPLTGPADAKDHEKTEDIYTSTSTPNNKKRRVTPNDDSGSKQKQQKKVNQMTLSSFFFQRSDNKTTGSTPSKLEKKMGTKSVLETLASPPRNVTSPACNSSPALMSESKKVRKDDTENHEVIDLVEDKNIASSKCTKLEGNSRESQSTDEINSPSTRSAGKTQNVSHMVGFELKLENADSPKNKLATPPGIGNTAAAASTNAEVVLPESIVVGKSSTGPDHFLSTKSVIEKNDENTKGHTRHRANLAGMTKATKPSGSHTGELGRKELSEDDLSEESISLLRKYRTLKERYLDRAHDVTNRHKDGLKEEDFGEAKLKLLPGDAELKMNDANHCEEYPAQVVANMALLIEGSDLSLSKLVEKICRQLQFTHNTAWSSDSVSAKIKLLSKRKAYFDYIRNCEDVVDLYEDNNRDRLWRWEVTTLDLLDSDIAAKARKARSARKKISSYQSALLRLVKSLGEAEKQILDPSLPNLDKSKAKISRDEDRVLNFERDAERQRVAEDLKARKLLEQEAKREAKRKAKEEASEAKRRRKEEAAEKKKEAAQAREDEKRKREEEKLHKEEEKRRQEKKRQATVYKQKATFRSFFAKPKKKASDREKSVNSTCADSKIEAFDAPTFRSQIDSSIEDVHFTMQWHKRSISAIACRRRRTKRVAVSVYKTVSPDDAEWGTPDYLEQTTIKVPNKYRFLSFHEDCRPAYRGTWMKNSSIVTGKNPFGKESSIIDYDYDSEAEWEEGDDEMGENVEDDSKNQEEELDGEGNAKMYDFDDGFCVADDRLLDNEEDADEDTKSLYKKKMLNREHEQDIHSNSIRIIAPAFGGLPLHFLESCSPSAIHVEGFDTDNVAEILSSYRGIQLSNPGFCVDAFPQLPSNDENRVESNSNRNANKDDYSAEAMIVLARFSHHSTHNSKDKLIEELRTSYPTLFSNRAKATRKLDAISIKKKHPKFAGVYWEVKSEILAELGLVDIMEKKVEDIIYDSTISEKVLPDDKKTNKVSPAKNDSTSGTKKNKAKNEIPEVSGSASKKRKTTKTNSKASNGTREKTNDKKVKSSKPTTGDKVKNEVPKRDASAGMKNLMAQFVKRSPVKNTSCSSKEAKKSSTSQ